MFENPVLCMRVLVFLLGISIGSFLNVVIYRLPRKESLISPPSHCPNCNHRLGALDLVPIFSYLFLKRKCRYCGVKISSRYAIIEGLTGVFFLAAFIWKDLSVGFIGIATLSILIIVSAGILIDKNKEREA